MKISCNPLSPLTLPCSYATHGVMHLTPHAQKESEHQRFLAEAAAQHRAYVTSLPAQHSPAQQAALTRTGSGACAIRVARKLALR